MPSCGQTLSTNPPMTDDIVEFLRRKHAALIAAGEYAYASGLDVAADEIERLRGTACRNTRNP
jgi:hypothetical protein